MKVIVVSNYFMFHDSATWDELVGHKDVDFTFLETDRTLSDDRKKMGYVLQSRPYIKHSSDMSDDELNKTFAGVDFVIYGSCEDLRVSKICKNVPNLLVTCEHLSKRKNNFLNFLAVIKWLLLDKKYVNSGEKFLLAKSSKVYKEFKHFGYKGHGYRYGYFPELKAIDKERDPYSLIWYGRVLSWKRVDYALYALKYLKEADSRYHLDIIGEGADLDNIKKLTKKLELEDSVTFHGFMNHDEIMEILSAHSIHMFTSDNGEGWGVALNEGLNSGCICFANSGAGSTDFLVDDECGFVFHNKRTLKKQLDKYLSLNASEIETMRTNARKRISELWNNKTAAFRLYELLLSLYNHKEFDKYQTGPISKIK